MDWKNIRNISGISALASMGLSILGRILAPSYQVGVCYATCQVTDWRDLFEEGTLRYKLGPVGEFLNEWFFYACILSLIVFVISAIKVWYRDTY